MTEKAASRLLKTILTFAGMGLFWTISVVWLYSRVVRLEATVQATGEVERTLLHNPPVIRLINVTPEPPVSVLQGWPTIRPQIKKQDWKEIARDAGR